MAFLELCCRSGGSNLNAGTLTGNSTIPGTAATVTYTGGTWVQATRTFTPAGGANPTTDGFASGQWVSIYPDGSSVTPYIAEVDTVGATTFTTHATRKSGTAPADGALSTSAKLGGAFLGPNAASGFPFNFIANTHVNSSGSLPRINCMNDATYSITANISTINADVTIQGFTTAYGDLGKAILDGGTTGASYNLIGTTVGANANLIDFECRNNGATGSSGGVFWNGTGQVIRCVFHDFRGSGLQSNQPTTVKQCEAYACNQSNTASLGGFNLAGQGACVTECIAHDNTGSNTNGFYINGAGITVVNCIADTNGARGFQVDSSGDSARIFNCDAYANGSDGLRSNDTGNSNIFVENCNFTKNGGYGINFAGAGKVGGTIQSCGFGAGTEANTSGSIGGTHYCQESGTVNYATNATPYNAPTTGDFRIVLAAAKGAGHGSYTQTAASYTGTVAYPDIGAVQHQDSGGGGGVQQARSMTGGMSA